MIIVFVCAHNFSFIDKIYVIASVTDFYDSIVEIVEMPVSWGCLCLAWPREMTSIPSRCKNVAWDLMNIWNYMLISTNGWFPASLLRTHREFERDYCNLYTFTVYYSMCMSLLRRLDVIENFLTSRILANNPFDNICKWLDCVFSK